MFKHLIITVAFLMGSFRLPAQPGNPFIQSFPPAAYQSNAYISSPQNWGIIQDNRGIMYVSNTSGVLEYDGISWRLVNGTGYEGHFRLAKNSDGRIFVGSNNNFGFLAPDSVGKIQFVSLLPHLKAKYPELTATKIAAVGRNVYFSSGQHIFRWSGKNFKVWNSKAGFAHIFSCHNQLYAIDKAKGLCVLEQEQFKALPGTKGFDTLEVTALLPVPATSAPGHNLLVVTYGHGLFKYKDQALQRLPISPAGALDREAFMHGISLADGTIALATVSRGVVIINPEGAVKKVIDKKSGLNDNTVIQLYKDREGGIWAALNKGISRLAYPSPLSYLNETSGLEGIVLSMLKVGNRLYAGTTSGLYVADEEAITTEFHKVPQLQNEVWKLLNQGDTLLIVSSPGVYVLANRVLKRVSPPRDERVYKTVYRSKRDPGKFYIGSSDGLAVITRHKGRWKWEGNIKGVNHDVVWLSEDKTHTLWASCSNNISAINDSHEYGLHPPVRNYKPPAALSEKLNRFEVYSINGNIYFGTSKGLYSFRKQGKRLLLKPDSTFGAIFARGTREVINLTADPHGQIWLTSEFKTGPLRKSLENKYTWDTIPLSKVPRVDVWKIYADPEGVVWLGTTEGIFRYNPAIPKNYKTQPQTVIRKIKLSGDSTVFLGAFPGSRAVSLTQSPQFKFTLPHAVRSISFEFAATSYEAPDQLLYSYMLEGEDNSWSRWTTETKKEYTGIDEGDYVFKVKSKNIYGAESLASTFQLSSLPPLYRSWWAYAFYGLCFLTGLIVIDRFQRRRLIQKERKKARTRELEQAREIKKAYIELKQTQMQLIQKERMASLGELTAGIAHEIQNPLNFVNNFSEVSKELIEELLEVKKNETADSRLEEELLADIEHNLSKIRHHGQRAEVIVKSMLLLSRDSLGERQLTDINALVDEYLRLTYAATKARNENFTCSFDTLYDPKLKKIEVVPQEVGNVLHNLFSNAFYAVQQKQKLNPHGYEPKVRVSTEGYSERAEIKVWDNGTGIPESLKQKIFQPFFTTKPAGQGTGLGLSLSYYIAKGHDGELLVATEEGSWTEFTIILPYVSVAKHRPETSVSPPPPAGTFT
ncbi:hypothetical protein I2I11_17525 [Pontibacter sp. 172403-2]|uniref:sensor histidine kinase n=1 Tax=Pontibacter rufus TaxID=2791028 RepID=UPI0018AFD38E|nr:sensor histidine kinase [Pontibacter sp. 172403-2]MBF9255103.1 hypothetical protein [Pontibacter sp. 172403-2]